MMVLSDRIMSKAIYGNLWGIEALAGVPLLSVVTGAPGVREEQEGERRCISGEPTQPCFSFSDRDLLTDSMMTVSITILLYIVRKIHVSQVRTTSGLILVSY